MTICSGVFKGELLIESTHQLSNQRLLTDAPLDNQGKGASYSPTDLVGVALATCILTTMGIVASREQIDLTGSRYTVEKKMSDTTPRRIASLVLAFELPSSLSEETRKKLERTANTCPVYHSLNSEVRVEFSFSYIL